MKPEAPQVVAARIETERTRTRLMESAHRLQARISPSALASNAWQGAKEKGARIAENAVDAVRKRPIAATGVVAAVTLFLAREPLMQLAEKLTDGFRGRENSNPEKKSTEKVA